MEELMVVAVVVVVLLLLLKVEEKVVAVEMKVVFLVIEITVEEELTLRFSTIHQASHQLSPFFHPFSLLPLPTSPFEEHIFQPLEKNCP